MLYKIVSVFQSCNFGLYLLLEIRVILILVVFNCVHVSFLSFDDVFFGVFWVG